MESNMTLTVGFKGGQSLNGQPVFNHDGAPLTVGGFIDTGNTATAYFGRVVSATSAAPTQFEMGVPSSSYLFAGIIQHDNAIGEYEPTKANYILPGLPATAVFFGPIWLKSWGTSASDALATPIRGCKVVCDITTGEINFLAFDTTSIPTGYEEIPARVMEVNTDADGVLLMIGLTPSYKDITLTNLITATTGTIRPLASEGTLSGTGISTSLYSIAGRSTLSGTVAGASYIAGVQGKLTITGTMNAADSRLAGILAQLDLSTATTTTGQLSVLWVDAGDTASANVVSTKGGGQFDLIRITNTTAANANSVICAYAEADYLFDLGGPGGNADWFDAGTGASASVSGHLKIHLNGTAAYIRVYASAS